MRFLLFLSANLLVMGLAGTWWSESEAWQQAEDALHRDSSREALVLLERLSRSRHLSIGHRQIELAKEEAAISAAREALSRPDFISAAEWVNLVLGGPTSGFETEAKTLAARLPELHLSWAERLLSQARPEVALEECSIMHQLYAERADVVTRIRQLEWRCQIARAQAFLREGDVEGMLETVARLAKEKVPLPVHAQADRLALQAIRQGTDHLYEGRDYPGLYRLLVEAATKLEYCPQIVHQLNKVQEDYDHKLFGKPTRSRARELSPAAVPDETVFEDEGIITIRNETDRSLKVLFRGPQKRDLVIGPQLEKRVALETGKYVQLADAGPGARPHLAILRVDNRAYRQAFEITNPEAGLSPSMHFK